MAETNDGKADSAEQDQSSLTCSLISIYTLPKRTSTPG